MRFILMGDWPCNGGALCVPAGTEIDGHDPRWRGMPLPSVMPVNAIALDQEAWDHLHRHHSANWFQLRHGPDFQPKKGENQ